RDLHDRIVLHVQVEIAAHAAIRADGLRDRLLFGLPLSRLAQLVLAAEHERAGRADGDAVAAIHARRLGQFHDELGRDARVESAPRDRDGERVLILLAAGVDALVTEDALGVVADVQLVVDLDRASDRGGRLAVRLDVVAGALALALRIGG